LVQANEAETTTASGLVIPDNAPGESRRRAPSSLWARGRFDDKGNRIPVDVQVGDTVPLLQVRRHRRVKYNGEEYLVLSARDVLAVIEK